MSKLWMATPFYKIPKATQRLVNKLPPYVDRAHLLVLTIMTGVYAIAYARNEYQFQMDTKLHTENNYPFEALKLIESDLRLQEF